MAEKLELVTDFASLKAGMIVVVKDCGWCGKQHRFILVKDGDSMLAGSDGSFRPVAHWEVLPEVHDVDLSGPMVVSAWTTNERRLYRVVDDLDLAREALETAVEDLCDLVSR